MIPEHERSSDRIYDACAASYGFATDKTLAARLKLELVSARIRPEHHVLDVGCANGLYMIPLASRCSEIVGIDINDRMLEVAREALQQAGVTNAQVHKQSATSLDFADASFDVVYSFSTLLLVPDTLGALGEIARVLKPGGWAVLDITGRYNLSRLYWSWYYRRHGHFGVNAYPYREIAGHLARLGLVIEEAHALGFTDQWRYVPGLHKLKVLDRLFHAPGERDLDYRLSNHPWLFPLANRWYLVCCRT